MIDTPEELNQHFERTMRRLRSASKRFDGGDEDAAYDLSVLIRILVHDTDASTSVLAHMGLKERLLYPDATKLPAPPSESTRPGTRKVMIPLFAGPWCLTEDEASWRLAPPFDGAFQDRMPRVTFDAWWSDPCGHDARGNVFSRRDLVLDVANKDGGAHVDRKLRRKYVALTRENSLGVSVTIPVELTARPIKGNPALVGIRQVAFELDSAVARIDDADAIPNARTPTAFAAMIELTLVDHSLIDLSFARDPANRNVLCPCGSGRKCKRCHGA